MLSLTAGTVHSYWMNNELFTKELGAWKNKSCIANLLNLLTMKETFKSSNGERVVSEWADLCARRPRLCKLSFQAIQMPNDIGQKKWLGKWNRSWLFCQSRNHTLWRPTIRLCFEVLQLKLCVSTPSQRPMCWHWTGSFFPPDLGCIGYEAEVLRRPR